MTNQQIAIHQCLRLLGDYHSGAGYHEKFTQIYGAVRVINWMGLGAEMTEIFDTALHLSAEETRGLI